MDLPQEICKKVSLKYTGIKQEPYSANQLQHDISQLQTDMQILKKSLTTPQPQYAAPVDTNPVVLQEQLSKIKAEMSHLQKMKCPNG